MTVDSNNWHHLACGAQVLIVNKKPLVVEVSMVIDSTTRELPPSDEVVLKEIAEVVGYPVVLGSMWIVPPDRPCKIASLKAKLVLDSPEQL